MPQSSRLAKIFDTLAIDPPMGTPILLVRATINPAYFRFETDDLYASQSFKPSHDALLNAGISPKDLGQRQAGLAVVELTRSKPENLYNVAKAYERMSVGAQLFIDGAKTDGIESISKALKALKEIEGSYSKAHGKTIWVTKPDITNPFKKWLNLIDTTQNSDGFYTAPGIFSADGIDPASALLMDHITQPLKGKGADLGAGWGYLSQRALQSFDTITSLGLFEAEQISLDCAQKNITDPRASFHWDDVQTMVQKTGYDFILMNPPFHQSRKAEPAIGRAFITKAAKMLTAKGSLWMVANKQLAYEASLDASFANWAYVHQDSKFKVIHAKRPK